MKLKHFAHPRGWEKGEAVQPIVTDGYKPAVMVCRALAGAVPEGQIEYLEFTNADARNQWVKWWSKK